MLYIVHQAGLEHLRQIGAVQSVIVLAEDASSALAAAKAMSAAHLQITDEWRATLLDADVAVHGPMLIEGHPLTFGGRAPRGA